MLPGGGWALAVAIVLFVLAAAKAHGRQVRLLRERAGIFAVDFRADNGPVVEGIWRRDRIRFWVGAASLAALLVTGSILRLTLADFPLAAAVAAALGIAFGGGFLMAGLAAWAELMRPREGDPDWLERANWQSFAWWTAVGAALALVAFAV